MSTAFSLEPKTIESAVVLGAGLTAQPAPGEDRYRAILEVLPAAVYATDGLGRITFYNSAAAALWGRRPAIGEEWCGSWRLFRSDGTPMAHHECPMAVALKTGHAVRGAKAMASRPDGTVFSFMAYPTPLRDGSGRITGAVNMLVDVTDREQSDVALQRLAAIVESSDDAIVSKDLNAVITSWNKGAERMFGYTAEEAIGRAITFLIPAERQHEEQQILGRIRRSERVDHFETVRRRKDGSLIDVSISVSPVCDSTGTVVGASKIARDDTERKRASERQEILLGEMKHRIANLITIIGAVAKQSRPKDLPVVEQYTDDLLGRLRAILGSGILAVSSASRTPDLKDLVRSTLQPFCDRQARVAISGPSLRISEQVSSGLAMALHELATNAVKFGALSNETGTVSVEWTVAPQDDGRRIELDWREQGGPAVAPPQRTGFGTRVINFAMSNARDGKVDLDFAPDGTCCRFSFVMDWDGRGG